MQTIVLWRISFPPAKETCLSFNKYKFPDFSREKELIMDRLLNTYLTTDISL